MNISQKCSKNNQGQDLFDLHLLDYKMFLNEIFIYNSIKFSPKENIPSVSWKEKESNFLK